MTSMAYESRVENQWCPGCPNFGILAALKQALASLGLPPHRVCLVSGIGQAAKLPHYVGTNIFNGLHGRALPAATGIHVANPELTTIVTSGDGCLYGEGGNHFLHALRRNPDITVISHNNQIYALTKGQASPTTRRGTKTRLQFDGVEVDPSQMLATAIVHGCTFVARGFAGDIRGLAKLLQQAIEHRGLALVDVLQPCITWGNHPADWYQDRVVAIPKSHAPSNRSKAINLALEAPDRFPVGVIYQLPPKETFAASYRSRIGTVALYRLEPIQRNTIDKYMSQITIDAELEHDV